jgi:hypothetical protein
MRPFNLRNVDDLDPGVEVPPTPSRHGDERDVRAVLEEIRGIREDSGTTGGMEGEDEDLHRAGA